MRPWASSRIATIAPGQAIVTTNETVVATIGGVSTQSPDSVVVLEAVAQLQSGATTTATTWRVRRGTDITGAVVFATDPQPTAAATVQDQEIQCQDAPGETAGASYVLTVQQTGATGNGTIRSGSLQVSY